MFENLKLTQRLKGFGKLFLASLLWLLVRPVSVVVSAPFFVVLLPIAFASKPFSSCMEELEDDPRESKAKQIKYWFSVVLLSFFFAPVLLFLLFLYTGIIYHIALFNQMIGGIIGDYSCVLLGEDDAKTIKETYVHESNWFKDGWSELFTSPPATPEIPPVTPEVTPATPVKDDPSPLGATRPSPDGMRSVTSDSVVDNPQATPQYQ